MINPDEFAKIQAVTFDAGGTLIEPSPSVGHVYAAVAAEHGIASVPVKTLNQQFAAAWAAKGKFDYTQAAWRELVEKSFEETGSRLPPGFFEALYARFARAEVWRVYDDVRPCLDILASRSVKLAIVSNWDERLHPLLDELKLTSYFDAIIISCDIGFTKPSPVIFEQALRKLGLPPEAVLHVGDSQTEDVDGAAAAGMKSLLLRRSDGVFPRELGSLRELEGVVPPFED